VGERFKSKPAKVALVAGLVLSIALAAILPWPHPFRVVRCEPVPWEVPHDLVAYLYAVHLEEAWSASRPRNRAELEQQLHFYSVQSIAPADSCWGKRYSLAKGQLMVRYLIAWHAPLDVVYDSGDRIQAIFTSYE
jgi:hypothetical protein